MGATKLSLTQLELNQPEEIYLKLTDPARPLKDLGEIKIVATLTPKTQEDKEQVEVSFVLSFHLRMKLIFSVDFRIRIFRMVMLDLCGKTFSNFFFSKTQHFALQSG